MRKLKIFCSLLLSAALVMTPVMSTYADDEQAQEYVQEASESSESSDAEETTETANEDSAEPSSEQSEVTEVVAAPETAPAIEAVTIPEAVAVTVEESVPEITATPDMPVPQEVSASETAAYTPAEIQPADSEPSEGITQPIDDTTQSEETNESSETFEVPEATAQEIPEYLGSVGEDLFENETEEIEEPEETEEIEDVEESYGIEEVLDASGGASEGDSLGSGSYGSAAELGKVTASSQPENGIQINMRGLSDGNREGTFNTIKNYLNLILEEGKFLTIKGDGYIDAEKFNVQVSPGYDSQHCWAATAANILWTTGYAQQLGFNSEDDVLTYFSERFTDYAGSPAEGLGWLFNGEGAYKTLQEMDANKVAHYRTDLADNVRNIAGLLPAADYKSRSTLSEVTANSMSAINSLENIAEYGMGVLVRWVEDEATGVLSNNAHWMTVVGNIIDTTKALSDPARYLGIVLANSDDNPVNGNINTTSENEKLAAKAAQENRYVVYRLSYDQKFGWLLDNFSPKKTVITYLYSLLDSNKSSEGDGDDTNHPNSYTFDNNIPTMSDNGIDAEVTAESTNMAEDDMDETDISDIADITYFDAFSSEELERQNNINRLFSFMTKNGINVFSLANGKITDGSDYVAYLRVSMPYITRVYLDGEEIPVDQITIMHLRNGLSKLVLKSGYLSKLSAGKHSVVVEINGASETIIFDVVK